VKESLPRGNQARECCHRAKHLSKKRKWSCEKQPHRDGVQASKQEGLNRKKQKVHLCRLATTTREEKRRKANGTRQSFFRERKRGQRRNDERDEGGAQKQGRCRCETVGALNGEREVERKDLVSVHGKLGKGGKGGGDIR